MIRFGARFQNNEWAEGHSEKHQKRRSCTAEEHVRNTGEPRMRRHSPGSVPQKYEFDEWVGVMLQPTSADARYSQPVIQNVQVHRFFSVRLWRRTRAQIQQSQQSHYRHVLAFSALNSHFAFLPETRWDSTYAQHWKRGRRRSQTTPPLFKAIGKPDSALLFFFF